MNETLSEAESLSPSEMTIDIPILKIRSMAVSDICTISKLHSIIMPTKYPIQFFQDLLEENHIALLGYDSKSGEILAFSTAKYDLDINEAIILTIGVLPEYQDLGFGTKILNTTIAILRTRYAPNVIRLHLENKNNRALHVYTRAGFTRVQEIIGYYGKGRNAIEMKLQTYRQEGAFAWLFDAFSELCCERKRQFKC